MAQTHVSQNAQAQANRLTSLALAVWRIALSSRLMLTLGGITSALLGLALLIPQVPLALLNEPAGRQHWEINAASTLPGKVVASLGFFDLLHHPLTHSVLALLLFCLLVRAGACLLAWQQSRSPLTTPTGQSVHLRLPFPSETIAQALQNELVTSGYALKRLDHALIALRGRNGSLLGLEFHAMLALAVSAVLLNSALAWGEPAQPLTVGDSGSSERAGLRWTVTELTPERAILAVTTLVSAAAAPIRSMSIPRHATLPSWPVDLRDTGRGLALRVSGRNEEGTPLILQTSTPGQAPAEQVTLHFDQPDFEQIVAVPSANQLLRLAAFNGLPEKQINGPVYVVQAFSSGQDQPLLTEYIQQTGDIQVQGSQVHLEPLAYVSITVSSQPGLMPALLAGLTSIVLLLLSLRQPTLRVWAIWAGELETALVLHAEEATLWRSGMARQAVGALASHLQAPVPPSLSPAEESRA